MTTGGRHDVGGTRPGGDELLDLLYGELPPDEERAVRARVAGDPALSAELAELERVRQLARALPDVEPPGRLTAQLLSQAAQMAPRRESTSDGAGSGLWARLRSWFGPLMAHPGLAAAASLVLLAGVAGVLIARGGDELTDVNRSAPANEAPTGLEASAPTPPPPPGAAPDPAAAGAAGATEGGAASGYAAPEDTVAQDEVSGSAAASADEARDSDERELKKGRLSRRRPRSESPADDKQAAGGDQDKAKAEGRKALGMRQSEPAPPAAAPVQPSQAQPAEEAEEQDGEAGSVDVAPEPPSPKEAPAPEQTLAENKKDAASARDLHKQAVSAAANRRCLEVQSLVENIGKVDAAYHDKVVQRDKRLSVCLSAGKPARAKQAK